MKNIFILLLLLASCSSVSYRLAQCRDECKFDLDEYRLPAFFETDKIEIWNSVKSTFEIWENGRATFKMAEGEKINNQYFCWNIFLTRFGKEVSEFKWRSKVFKQGKFYFISLEEKSCLYRINITDIIKKRENSWYLKARER